MSLKTVWKDTETTGLDTEVSHVLDLAWLREYEGVACPKGPRRYLLQPVLHKDDKLYGHIPIEEFVQQYNSHFENPKDPQRLLIFESDKGSFTYSEGSLTFNVQPPDVIDPSTWLSPDRISPAKALEYLIEDLQDKTYRPGRWTIAGYNVETFDRKIILTLFKRVYGIRRGQDIFGRLFNNYYTMDVMHLVRWHQYSGYLEMDNSRLTTAAETLGLSFDIDGAHTAAADMLMSRRVGHKLLKMDKT